MMSPRALRLIPLVVAATAVLAGCASTHGLAPESSLRDPKSVAAAQALRDVAVSNAAWPAADWWKSLNDPQLDALMDEALADSPTLRIAAARTRKALAAAQAAHAARLPRVDASASSTRERLSQNGIVPPPLGGSVQTFNQLEATLGWEVDFWGRNREASEAAFGTARATEVDQHAARLALSTSVARTYVQLQRAYLQRDVAQRTLAEREQLYALTRDRNAAGLDSRLELKQAESALPATREQIVQWNERIALAGDELAALLGAGPDRGLAIGRPSASALAAAALPSVLPAELLGRRPDLVAQRWRIEAARHDIASAKAEFYPNVNLVAFVGLQSLGGAAFLNAASRTFGAGPAVTLPIFDGGRLRANLSDKDADYDIAVEQYNQSIADAMREVVDQVVSFRSLEEQRREHEHALATAREAYDLALLRYREGIGNYLQVLSAEQPLLAQQAIDADLQARGLDLSINLVHALGGGYAPPAPVIATGTTR